jgi:hypothetical protein
MENSPGTTVVRIASPPDVSRADFLASIRSWLDHHCIMLANFKSVAFADMEGVFDVEFDNPRDARLFERRFASQSHARARAFSIDAQSRRSRNAHDSPFALERAQDASAI